MGNRRKAREAALQVLYQVDLSKINPGEALELFWMQESASAEIKDFTTQLVEVVLQNQAEVDQLVEKHATHWKLLRMACVDRNILRLAVYELLCCKDIPKSVSLNEAIELGKKFGTEESGSFINGVLDHIAKEIK